MEYHIPENTHVVLLTPAYGGLCHIQYTLSCMQWASFHEAYNLKWNNIFIYNEALIQRARNYLITQFLKIPTATHLFFVDADISFRVDDYVRMLAANKDIIVGAYPKKVIRWDLVKDAVLSGKDNLHAHSSEYAIDFLGDKEPKNLKEPFKVEHGGTGFMLIKRKVIEKMVKKAEKYVVNRAEGTEQDYNLFSVEIDENGLLLSEDYYFCKQWRKMGGSIWCAPWVELTHFGTHPFKGKFISDDYL